MPDFPMGYTYETKEEFGYAEDRAGANMTKNNVLLAMSLDGMITLPECELLYQLAGQAGRGCIVEIGSYRGRSTATLAYGASNSKRQVPVFAIDPHEYFTGPLGGVFGPEDRCAFFRNMLDAGICDLIRLVNLSSKIVSPGWKLPISLLWIDGDHTKDGIRRDIEGWEPHVITGGIIAIHDSVSTWTAPHAMVNELLKAGRFKMTKQVGEISVLKKLGSKYG